MIKLLRANDQGTSTFTTYFLKNIEESSIIKFYGGTRTEDKYRDYEIDGGTHYLDHHPPGFVPDFIAERAVSSVLKYFPNTASRRTDPRGLLDYATWKYFPDNGLTRFKIPVVNAGTITTVCLSSSQGSTFFEVSDYLLPIPGTFILNKLTFDVGEEIEVLDFTIGAAEVR